MGQSASTSAGAHSHDLRQPAKPISTTMVSPIIRFQTNDDLHMDDDVIYDGEAVDFINNLPDECLACIFQSLSSGDRKRCSLVCKRWFLIEAQSRLRLSLNAQSELVSFIPSIFTRFDSLTKLALKCDRRSVSINDEGLVLISLHCRKLTRLKLRSCRELTDLGISEFTKNCINLKKFSCGSCNFGVKGMDAVFNNCAFLEELSLKRLRGLTNGAAAEPIGPGLAAQSLKVICLKELYNGLSFAPLIVGSKNLKVLKLFRCPGDWDRLLEVTATHVTGLVEVHLERLQVGDFGLGSLSRCSKLETLHLVKTPECTNNGLKTVAESCRLLRKLHIDGWKTNRISDEGLIAVAKNCPNLQELVLIGVNPTHLSLEKLATGCVNLERLALCGSGTVGDEELCCIAEKCVALKKLCIKSCPVSDVGMEALAGGCPNLVKVKVKKCRAVTSEGADWLRSCRGSLAVNLDASEIENLDASASDSGAQEGAVDNQQMAGVGADVGARHAGRSTSFKSRLGLLTGKRLVACTFRRWSSFGGSSRNN